MPSARKRSRASRPTVPLVGTMFGNDSPRARRGDRATSHRAADATAPGIKVTKERVLRIVLAEGPIVGSQINDLYDLRTARHGWRPIHFDSPRKRAGELAEDGYLRIRGERISPRNHLPESEYAITAKGRKALGVKS